MRWTGRASRPRPCPTAVRPRGRARRAARRPWTGSAPRPPPPSHDGATILILSDRGVDAEHVAVPALLATAAVHHHLIRAGLRTRCGLVVETGEAREIHHFALLIGYGAGGRQPVPRLRDVPRPGADAACCSDKNGTPLTLDDGDRRTTARPIDQGLLKIFSKMGISTLLSYRGRQIFEAIGLGHDLIERHFTGTPSRLGGIGLDVIARGSLQRHAVAFPAAPDHGGARARRRRRVHVAAARRVPHVEPRDDPEAPARRQQARRSPPTRSSPQAANDESRHLCTLRGLLEIRKGRKPIPLELVEPAKEIVKRFCTGAMSFGSISKEAHETLAIAMNRIGGRSNTGEGGEDPARFKRDANGDSRNSAIKQVASGRFGVTANYLANAVEIADQDGPGGQAGRGRPAARPQGRQLHRQDALQHAGRRPDLAAAAPRHLQHRGPGPAHLRPEERQPARRDLGQAGRRGRASAPSPPGVAKGYADRILISGDSGGTGASPLSSIRHAGIPWELGLAETQQTLVRNGLRGRVRLQTDGQLKTGRDVIVAACLGAEEYGFATAPLIAMGCIMMRKCHLNTCPVGIATQDPVLRARFTGTPEQVVNYLFFVAEEVREYLSAMGFRSLDEIIGRADLLAAPSRCRSTGRRKHLDLAPLLHDARRPARHADPLRRAAARRAGRAARLGAAPQSASDALEKAEARAADACRSPTATARSARC